VSGREEFPALRIGRFDSAARREVESHSMERHDRRLLARSRGSEFADSGKTGGLTPTLTGYSPLPVCSRSGRRCWWVIPALGRGRMLRSLPERASLHGSVARGRQICHRKIPRRRHGSSRYGTCGRYSRFASTGRYRSGSCRNRPGIHVPTRDGTSQRAPELPSRFRQSQLQNLPSRRSLPARGSRHTSRAPHRATSTSRSRCSRTSARNGKAPSPRERCPPKSNHNSLPMSTDHRCRGTSPAAGPGASKPVHIEKAPSYRMCPDHPRR
jgi:hypothetical protein